MRTRGESAIPPSPSKFGETTGDPPWPTSAVADRRRILLAVEPRVLGDALAAVLDAVGLDDVIVNHTKGAHGTSMHIDAAVVSDDSVPVVADVVIHVPIRGSAHVSTPARNDEVTLRTPEELLTILDRYCPSTAPRVPSTGADGAQR
jgi:hypothetical protein